MLEPQSLRHFSPLDALSETGLGQAAEAMTVQRLGVGGELFRKGERDHAVYFLLSGRVALRSDPASAPLYIEADTDAAHVPLSRLKPRRYTAIAATPVEVAVIDEDLLDNLLTADQTTAYEVTEISGEDPEWMFRLICDPAFAKIPSHNFAILFSRLETVEVPDGEVIVRQGEIGDYYYIIRQGKADVWRAYDGDDATKVAQLGAGDTFGEEALLSGEPRNATVVMAGAGKLMRLAQADFDTLLKPPLVHRVDPGTAAILVGAGARFLDVRSESEFREFSLPSSVNLPLGNLRGLAEQLDPRRKYITVCESGRRASAAAFLLGQRGFDVCVLEGGLIPVFNNGNS
ncbi:cyclic nucleotide-binding domain-containing protein [Parasulfuritortus cantonensis]|nr:cyclic nucleotide-binding domain-containing protein [Parasulfuritortus cantonensis]